MKSPNANAGAHMSPSNNGSNPAIDSAPIVVKNDAVVSVDTPPSNATPRAIRYPLAIPTFSINPGKST